MADRFVVIVPRNAPETFAYLTESFRAVPDVEVVLDRRVPGPDDVRQLVERRAADRPRGVEAFGCTLIRVARPAAPALVPIGAPAPLTAPAEIRRVPSAPTRLRLRTLPVLKEG
ncbi:MAG: hypothetical protein FJ027_23735 [Candidatus Rokubacteria bacterium]|nr:hypothetical protein [Candidatus Rokubacteria bacterium]